MFRLLRERPEALNARLGQLWIVSEAILGAFEHLGRHLLPQGSFGSAQEASCDVHTAAWNVSKIHSSAQKAKWCPQTTQSSKQGANCSIEKAEDNGIFFEFSVVKVSPQARPKAT